MLHQKSSFWQIGPVTFSTTAYNLVHWSKLWCKKKELLRTKAQAFMKAHQNWFEYESPPFAGTVWYKSGIHSISYLIHYILFGQFGKLLVAASYRELYFANIKGFSEKDTWQGTICRMWCIFLSSKKKEIIWFIQWYGSFDSLKAGFIEVLFELRQ